MASILGRFGDKIVEELKAIIQKDQPKQKQQYADCIIRNSKGELLLLHRSNNDDFQPHTWCLAGGKIEAGEAPHVAAKRELFEETGIDIDVAPIKSIEKDDCVIHYHEGFAEDAEILDNDEHYGYEFVPFSELNDYDLILDLGTVLKDLQPLLSPVPELPESHYTNIEEMIAMEGDQYLDKSLINEAFDNGLINEDDWLLHQMRHGAIEVIKKGYDEGLVSDEKFYNTIEKAKHHEFVQVTREGKTFYQYREVGTDKMDEDIETGDTVDTKDLGLVIKKYSDKSFLVTGETLKNLDLLRKIKQEVGFGAWNKGLNGWIFPLSGKDKMMALLAEKMPVDTYDEQVKKDAAIALKNAVDVGTEVSFDNLYGFDDLYSFVDEVTTTEDGKVEYTIQTVEQPEETPTPEAEPEAPKEEEKPKVEPVTKTVTEEEIGFPAATGKDAEDLINNATEENRMKTTKLLTGKEAGEKPVSDEIETAGQKEVKIESKEFATRSGEKINALDFTKVKQDEIQLSDITTILDKPKPYYIPDINEYVFSGATDSKFVFDYVKIDDNNFIIALNGHGENKYTNYRNDPRLKDAEHKHAVVSLDNLVAITEYYKTKRKAELKRGAEIGNAKRIADIANWNESAMNYYKPFNYTRLSDKQKKKYTEEAWNALSMEEKLKEVPNMKSKPVSIKNAARISPLEDDYMLRSNFEMYKQYVDKSYKSPFDRGVRNYTSDDPCAMEYNEARKQIKWKKNDLEIQREENDSSFTKGRETSYGDSNTKDHLLETHGVKIKAQNGSELLPMQIEQIKDNLNKVYQSFGDRSSMSKNFGLKISHAGDKHMHAMKALGVYIPSMRAIGVTDNDHGKFGFTLAHEYAHFLDNMLGSKGGYRFASDSYNSTAGKIANVFRDNLNKKTDDKYLNRTVECFARALEQYHAMKHNGEDAIKSQKIGKTYHESPEHVSKEKFNTLIKPLIEQFLSENDYLLKSAGNEIDIFQIENPFIWN